MRGPCRATSTLAARGYGQRLTLGPEQAQLPPAATIQLVSLVALDADTGKYGLALPGKPRWGRVAHEHRPPGVPGKALPKGPSLPGNGSHRKGQQGYWAFRQRGGDTRVPGRSTCRY